MIKPTATTVNVVGSSLFTPQLLNVVYSANGITMTSHSDQIVWTPDTCTLDGLSLNIPQMPVITTNNNSTYFTDNIVATINNPNSSGDIVYSLNDEDISRSYNGPITIKSDCVIRAKIINPLFTDRKIRVLTLQKIVPLIPVTFNTSSVITMSYYTGTPSDLFYLSSLSGAPSYTKTVTKMFNESDVVAPLVVCGIKYTVYLKSNSNQYIHFDYPPELVSFTKASGYNLVITLGNQTLNPALCTESQYNGRASAYVGVGSHLLTVYFTNYRVMTTVDTSLFVNKFFPQGLKINGNDISVITSFIF